MTGSASRLLLLFTILFIPLAVLAQSSSILTVTVAGFPECSDTIDNDGDTFIDWPADADCTSAADTLEAPPLPPGGGGGGGGGNTSQNYAVFRGKAYPGSKVTLLKDGQFAASTNASPDGSFDITLRRLSAGTYTFSVFGTDNRNVKSASHAFTVGLTKDVTNIISGIFLPPTISADKSEVKYGDIITLLGQTNPQSEITVFFHSSQEVIKKIPADTGGTWLLNFDTTELERGNHTAQSRALKGNEVSPLSDQLGFKVGSTNVFTQDLVENEGTCAKGDVNCDGKVNIVDFSILAYWFKRPNPPGGMDLNADRAVDIRDFSIVAYYWNG